MHKTIILASFLLASPFAFAEHHMGAVSFTFGGGFVNFDSKRHLRHSGLPYFGLGYDFNDCFGVEGVYSTFHSKFKQDVPDRERVSNEFWLFDVVYRPESHIFPCHLTPFIAAGVGVTAIDPNWHDANNQGNVNVGVGLQYFIHPQIAFRLDAKDIYTIVGGRNDVLFGISMSLVF